jgi:ankyrin repeat protein
MDYLMDQTSEAELEDALGNMNSGSDGLKNTYERTLDRIRAQTSKKRELANRILTWLTHSYRALTISELREALAIEPQVLELNQRARPRLQMLDSVCAGLINIDQNTGVVQLAHKTVKEYFDETSKFPDAHVTIAKACLTYLSFDAFSSGMCPTQESFNARLDRYPLFDYAARHWASHASVSRCESEHILSLLRHDGKTSACEQVLYGFPDVLYASPRDTSKTRGVHLAAMHGLQSVMSTLLEEGQPAESRGYLDRTPLLYAAEYGRTHMAKILLRTYKVNPNFTDVAQATALSLAAKHGNVELVRTLLEVDQTDPNIPNLRGWTPLMYAAAAGSLEVVEELVRDSRTNINCSTQDEGSALHIAAEYLQEAVCLRLLEQDDIDLTICRPNGRSVLHMAAHSALSTTVQHLLKMDNIDVNARDLYKDTPLLTALAYPVGETDRRRIETTKIFSGDHRVQLNATDGNGETALMRAIKYRHVEAAQFLLAQERVDVNVEDNQGWTALLWAASIGEADLLHALACRGARFDLVTEEGKTALHYTAEALILRDDSPYFRTADLLLTTYGLEADQEDATGRAPISYASEGGNFSICELLISKYKVDINRKDHLERTPFSYAAEQGLESILQLLLEAGFTGIDLQDKNGRTPFSYAAEEDCDHVMKLLLAAGFINVNLQDKDGRSPLSYAAAKNRFSVIKLLSQIKDLDVDQKDVLGRTPLSYAAKHRDSSEVILYLLSLGADINSKDAKENTPLCYAARGVDLDNTKTLLEKGALVTKEVQQVAEEIRQRAEREKPYSLRFEKLYELIKEEELLQRS